MNFDTESTAALWSAADWVGRLLVISAWQGLAIAAVLAIALATLRRADPRWQYALACAALLLVPISTAGTLMMNGSPGITHPVVPVDVVRPASVVTSVSSVDAPVPLGSSAFDPARLFPVLTAIWVIGLAIIVVLRVGGFWRIRSIVRAGRSAAGTAWTDVIDSLRATLRIARPVTAVVCDCIASPMVVGLFRPMILLPAAALSGLPVDHVRALLAHELAHVRRHDYFIHLIQLAIETLFYFHPAVWWISRQVSQEREYCCDDIAAGVVGSPAVYARALAGLEEQRVSFVLAAAGGRLLPRVRRLLRQPLTSQPAGRGAIAAVVIFTIAAVLMIESTRRRAPAVTLAASTVVIPTTAPATAAVPSTQSAAAAAAVTAVEQKLDRDEAVYLAVRKQIDKHELISVDDFAAMEPILAKMIADYADAVAARDELSKKFGPNNRATQQFNIALQITGSGIDGIVDTMRKHTLAIVPDPDSPTGKKMLITPGDMKVLQERIVKLRAELAVAQEKADKATSSSRPS